MTPEDMLARVLHRDGLMLVIDKPAGLPVHRGPKGGASLEDFFDALRYGLPRPPALAHRLDKETSGCLVLGRHRKALAHLGLLFKHGKVGKTYWAVVEGGPQAEEGTIDLSLGRLDATRGWWMKPDPKGVPAVTKWTVLGRCELTDVAAASSGGQGAAAPLPPFAVANGGEGLGVGGSVLDNSKRPPPPTPPRRSQELAGGGELRPSRGKVEPPRRLTWLALEPLTGRTHQLRVHCAARGWPIVGDNIYGTAPRFGGPGLHLHAREIVVPIQKSRAPVRVVAPVPAHMAALLTACGWTGEV